MSNQRGNPLLWLHLTALVGMKRKMIHLVKGMMIVSLYYSPIGKLVRSTISFQKVKRPQRLEVSKAGRIKATMSYPRFQAPETPSPLETSDSLVCLLYLILIIGIIIP